MSLFIIPDAESNQTNVQKLRRQRILAVLGQNVCYSLWKHGTYEGSLRAASSICSYIE